MKLVEAIAKPIGTLRRQKKDFFEVVGGRSKWVTAFHGTAQTFDELRPRDGIIWATMSPEHASSYAQSLRAHMEAPRNQAAPTVHLLRVNIAGYLIVDGAGSEIREIDAMDWKGWSPYDIASTYHLPGILFRHVYDTVDDDLYRRRSNILCIVDVSRMKPLFGNH